MDEFYAFGGVVYQKTGLDAKKDRKVCIIFEDEKGENRKLLVEALNAHSKKGQSNVS